MSWSSEIWQRLAALPLTIEATQLSFPSLPLPNGWTRVTTVIALQGLGEEGRGEDVTYEAEEHERTRQLGPQLQAEGTWTLGDFCALVAATDLFPGGAPDHEVSRNRRTHGRPDRGCESACCAGASKSRSRADPLITM